MGRTLLAALAIIAWACSTPTEPAATSPATVSGESTPIGARGYEFPPSPTVPNGDLPTEVRQAVAELVASAETQLDLDALEVVGASGDGRLAWLIADLLRFLQIPPTSESLVTAFESLTGVDVDLDPSFPESAWRSVTDHLIAWDLPAPPAYQAMKADLFLLVEPGWEPFLTDVDADIDWRLVSWGGVFIDDRPLGDNGFCERGCIPALDDPALVDSNEGDWFLDIGTVFGVSINGEAVAFPKNMMEIHEMVNITIGGRRLGIPYCTLCGSAQAYFLDHLPTWSEPIVLRTSGLLSRSNKVMYDLESQSVINTFNGTALSGPLQEAEVVLEQTTVVASLWGDWKEAHPETRIVARDGGIGRSYPDDPLQGRDLAGPIFPVGEVDPRLPVQELIVGAIGPDGPVAFPVEAARKVNQSGGEVFLGEVRLVADGSGFRAELADGTEVASHQAFWFAWSQFHPDTQVWAPG